MNYAYIFTKNGGLYVGGGFKGTWTHRNENRDVVISIRNLAANMTRCIPFGIHTLIVSKYYF